MKSEVSATRKKRTSRKPGGRVWRRQRVDVDGFKCRFKAHHFLHRRQRDAGYAAEFMNDVAGRLANCLQLTTDGYAAYLDAVDDAFAGEIDYAMLIKVFGQERAGEAPVCMAANPTPIVGTPERKHISTSFVERQNLTMLMGMRRFTRLTNGFSKKIENHMHAVALHYMHYNFCRVHKTLRVTPAMEAGIANHVWELEELVGLAA